MADQDKPKSPDESETDPETPRDDPDRKAQDGQQTAEDEGAEPTSQAEAPETPLEPEPAEDTQAAGSEDTTPAEETESGAASVEAEPGGHPEAGDATAPEAQAPEDDGASAVEAQPDAAVDDPSFADYEAAPRSGGEEPSASGSEDRDAGEAAAEAATEPAQPAPWAASAGATAAATAGGAVADSAAERDAETGASGREPPQREVVVRRGGFVPALLGGILAAVLGFAAARYVVPEGWPFPGTAGPDFRTEVQTALDAQAERIDQLQSQLADAQPDLTPITERLDTVGSDLGALSSRVDDLAASTGGQLSEIEARLSELEKRPMEGAVSQEAIAAYERELQALMDQVAEQRAEIEEIAADAMSREEQAAEAARRAEALSALSQLVVALDAGEPYAEELGALDAALEGAVPEALAAPAADGVATLAELRDRFPEAARSALAAARDAEELAAEDPGARVTAFLRDRLGARSVAPREGDDPDAVLSRAEAALRAGELGRALEEVAALPETAQSDMAEWTSAARLRHEAKTAADSLAQTLNEE